MSEIFGAKNSVNIIVAKNSCARPGNEDFFLQCKHIYNDNYEEFTFNTI